MNRSIFFAQVRERFGHLAQSQVDGFNAVLDAIESAPISHQAYMLATAWHETNGTMRPVREAYWLSEEWRKTHLRYYPWYGRGYVQTTWKPNYARLDAEAAEAGLIQSGDILANPDLAMRPDLAALALRRGMDEGWFTTKKMSDYLPGGADDIASEDQFEAARHIINGVDCAHGIAAYALNFQRAVDAAA